jgi:hypothetical protein
LFDNLGPGYSVVIFVPVQQRAETGVNDVALQTRADPDRVLERQIEGAPDLVHLHQDVRGFLSDAHDRTITDAALVVVMLASDAVRHGAPPITLRLRRSPGRGYLRVEVDDHRPVGADPVSEACRIRLLDRMTNARGVASGDGTTTTWAEIPLNAG